MKNLFLTFLPFLTIRLSAAIIVSTDFSGISVSGSTANNLSFTTNGILSPGSSITAVENEGNSILDGSTENGGLFDTTDTTGTTTALAFDLNVNEDGWYFDIGLDLDGGTSQIDITTLDINFRQYNSSGGQRGNTQPSIFRAEIFGSTSGQVASDSTGEVNSSGFGPHSASLDLSAASLVSAETWTLRVYTDVISSGGNFIGVDDIELNGTITAIPEPSSIVLIGLAGLALLASRRRR